MKRPYASFGIGTFFIFSSVPEQLSTGVLGVMPGLSREPNKKETEHWLRK